VATRKERLNLRESAISIQFQAGLGKTSARGTFNENLQRQEDPACPASRCLCCTTLNPVQSLQGPTTLAQRGFCEPGCYLIRLATFYRRRLSTRRYCTAGLATLLGLPVSVWKVRLLHSLHNANRNRALLIEWREKHLGLYFRILRLQLTITVFRRLSFPLLQDDLPVIQNMIIYSWHEALENMATDTALPSVPGSRGMYLSPG